MYIAGSAVQIKGGREEKGRRETEEPDLFLYFNVPSLSLLVPNHSDVVHFRLLQDLSDYVPSFADHLSCNRAREDLND